MTAPGPDSRWSIRMTESVMRRNPVLDEKWEYTSGLVLSAIGRVWEAVKDPRYLAYIKDNIDRFVDDKGNIQTYRVDEFNLDQINSGKALFLLNRHTRDARYRKALSLLAGQLKGQPRTSEGGFWHKKIYPHQMWLDGIYMASPFYAQLAAENGDSEGFDDVVRQITLIYSHTRDARTGLLYHGWDEARSQLWADKKTGCSPHFWGRAMGWYLMALVDVLDYLPADHPGRPRVGAILAETSSAVAAVQDRESGLWYQVLDRAGREGNYREASASCMFVYAFAKGVRLGCLEPKYMTAARKGHAGIVKELIEVDSDGSVHLTRVCEVAGLGGATNRDGSFTYYIGEPIVTDDNKGIGAFILASVEMEQANGRL